MHPFHVGVSLANLLALSSALIGASWEFPSVLATGIVLGYVTNLLALVVAVAVAVFLCVRAPSGRARQAFRSSWLGLLNGVVVVLAWSIFLNFGRRSCRNALNLSSKAFSMHAPSTATA